MNKKEFKILMDKEDLSPINIADYSFMNNNNVSLGTNVPYLGFDIIPIGWIQIIKVVMNILEKDFIENNTTIRIQQIKEKFGELRISINGGNRDIHDIISIAEEISRKTCMKCGKPGKIDESNYWITTYCDNCKK